jgi:hypothetical protein
MRCNAKESTHYHRKPVQFLVWSSVALLKRLARMQMMTFASVTKFSDYVMEVKNNTTLSLHLLLSAHRTIYQVPTRSILPFLRACCFSNHRP